MAFSAVYYVDGLNGNDGNDGLSFGNAWKTIQYALDTASGYVQIRICATIEYVLTAQIDDDTNYGNSTGWMDIVGANASGEIDGTKAVLNGNSAVNACLQIATGNRYKRIRNITFKNAIQDGLITNGNVFYVSIENCTFQSNGRHGLYGYYFTYSSISHCSFLSNSGYAAYFGGVNDISFCLAITNSQGGFYLVSHDNVICGSIIHDCATYGIRSILYGNRIINNIIDGCSCGIAQSREELTVLGNRITNCSVKGIECTSSRSIYEDWNYYSGNASDISGWTGAGYLGDNSLLNQATTGYNDIDNHDFNLISSTLLRRDAVLVGAQ